MSSPALAGWRLAPVVAGLLAAAAQAQTSTLAPVQITGNPLRAEESAAPATVLRGDELVLRRGSSLGETLAGQPGVSSTWFGPNANRPVIRGLDGDRIRILENAGASFDASSLSFDHAVPIDPLVVERIEVLRGPAALLYGGSAVGGVVNSIDNRIPRQPVQGVGGAVEARVGGADAERGGAALVESGNGALALHVDAFGRETSDLRVPRHTPVADGQALDPTTRVRNAASRANGAALGVSRTWNDGYLGVSLDQLDSRYGAVAEPDTVIRLQREHLALAGEQRGLGGFWRTVRGQIGRTVYQHREIEGTGEVGTTFDHRGTAGRLEAEHAPVAGWRGVVGLQAEDGRFAALGEEAFVPSTRTRALGAFVLEERAWSQGTFNAGLRVEHVKVWSAGDAPGADPQFGAATERRFTPASASLSHLWKLDAAWGVATTASFTQRAPTSFELFANGVHAATGAYERGDTGLSAERSRQLELALQWQRGEERLRVGVFEAWFGNYIALEPTGATVEDVPEYVFRAVRARLRGIELEGRKRLLDAPWTLDLTGNASLTRGTDRDSGEPLPRIGPLRATLGLEARQGPWRLGAEVDHAARQNQVPATDTPTPGWTMVNLSLARRFTLGSNDALWFVKAANLGDTLAYSASAVPTIRELAPLPGRSLKTGLRVVF